MAKTKGIYHLICKICDTQFTTTSTSVKICNQCKSKDIKINCDYCGNELILKGYTKIQYQYLMSPRYHYCCSPSCRKRYATLKNPQIKINEQKRLIEYNKSEKGRKKSSEVGKIQGPIAMKKAHDKYDKESFCGECNEITKHIIGIGCMSCFNKKEEYKKLRIDGIKEKYGDEYTNVFQAPEIKEKIKQTSIERYGCENPGNSRDARIKAANTLRGNDNDSSWEDHFEVALDKLGIEYRKRYDKDKRYPFPCDFYLPKTDIFIEINGYWSHGRHFFDENNPNDVEKLNEWKEKASQGHKQYINAVNVWANKDIEKLNYAKKNNLNYIVLWNMKDIHNYIKEIEQ